jgi:predicted amino acid-binding ACT domain protein
MVSGRDGVGRAAEVLRHLADARINVHAATGTVQSGNYGIILWVQPSDAEAAMRALRL